MKKKNTAKTWQATRYQSLYRHASGTYYARLTVSGRKTWRSLRTELLEVARTELAKLLQGERERSEMAAPQGRKGSRTLGQLAGDRLEIALSDTSTKESTKKYQREVHEALFRFFPRLEKRDIRKVSEKDCREWAVKHCEYYSPVRFNTALGVMKQIFDLAVRQGLRMSNPAKDLKRAKVVGKDLGLILPEPDVFANWVAEIRNSPWRFSMACADLVEFLSYSGLRPDTEAAFVTWKHCDFRKNELVVTGDPQNEGTKNRSTRRIPMNADLRSLLDRMRDERKDEPLSTPILQVNKAKDTMRTAAKAVGMEKITRYDLRHLFATRCLESGVDAATLANWLGHKDKGALVLKVYAHVRNPHSHAAAAKVSFGAK